MYVQILNNFETCCSFIPDWDRHKASIFCKIINHVLRSAALEAFYGFANLWPELFG